MNSPTAPAAPTTARPTQVPPGTAIHATLPGADFFDAYEENNVSRRAKSSG